ncbi:uncharacterized protein F4807DRAFT_453476 [Annulohypoxylon truncatum]|uniref:uncharacterized protein n=1 Tax=Annulohypoxylon truncatum TaxID=327061 RepID=UPI0020074A4D|nr:uncharacterized protein F4807DRAFT_453476 [Annulohypoxylon truncatum]KAI1206264.1 hypothetical protein F4807DRAFT_453476 [Annulohypoxylon truncatum]
MSPETKKSRRNSPASRSQQSFTSDSSDRGCTSDQQCNDSRPTRKRASKPKVRTGCISCKRRHVKCDEGKPSCAECERLGLMCEGYALPKTKTLASRPERLLLPKPKLRPLAGSGSKPSPSPQRTDHRPSVPLMPSYGFGWNEDDVWYFTLFKDQICHELSPYYITNFWTQTSLRDSMVNRCIHHSILGIGAYGRALMELRNEHSAHGKGPQTWWPPSKLNRHHQAALMHHSKALSHLRSNIGLYGLDGRLTMAATLLFIVFENMQGNYHSSGSLIRSGIKVLTNIRSTSPDSRSILRRQWDRYLTTPRDEVDDMTNMFARHSITSACLPFAHGKYAYHMLFTEGEEYDNSDDLGLCSPFTFTIPQTLDQARQIWDYLMIKLANFQSKVAWHNLNPDYDFDKSAAYREQAIYLSQLHDLGMGLDSLLFSPMDIRESKGLELLRLHHKVAVVAITCCLDPTEMMYDEFLSELEDVVQRCKLFMEFPTDVPVKVGFTNEAGRLPLLAHIGAKCRTARVRAEVVELLRASDWREGPWDSWSLANAVSGIMKIEGQLGMENAENTVPAKARYMWTNVFWDFEKQQMHVEYTKVLPNALGEFEKVHCVMGEPSAV